MHLLMCTCLLSVIPNLEDVPRVPPDTIGLAVNVESVPADILQPPPPPETVQVSWMQLSATIAVSAIVPTCLLAAVVLLLRSQTLACRRRIEQGRVPDLARLREGRMWI